MQLRQQVEIVELDNPTKATCEFNGQTYEAGEGFMNDCNSCSCSENGQIACTAMACNNDEQVEVNSTVDWETYTDPSFKLVFQFPPTFVMDPPRQSDSLNLVFKESGSQKSFTTRAFNEYLPMDAQYILDQEPTKSVDLNGTNWNFVHLERGYEVPPGGVGTPTFGYSTETGGRLYKVYFYNFANETETGQILSTFEFTNTNNADASDVLSCDKHEDCTNLECLSESDPLCSNHPACNFETNTCFCGTACF